MKPASRSHLTGAALVPKMRPDMPSILELDSRPRKELVEEASQLGVERPERMTRVELRDEILRRTAPPDQQAEVRGLFGVARSMIASVVESGLNLPDAAKAIRGEGTVLVPMSSQTPVATVTLAEIYASQGHKQRALRMIEEVLRAEPDHEEAQRVRRVLTGDGGPDAVSSPSSSREKEPAELPRPAADESTSPFSQSAPSQSAPTPDYVPAGVGVMDTTGEEVKTGKPPLVEVRESTPEPVPQTDPDEAIEARLPVSSPEESGAAPTLVQKDETPSRAPSADDTGSSVAARAEESDEGATLDPADIRDAERPPSGDEQEEQLQPAVAEPSKAEPSEAALLLAARKGGFSLYWEIPDTFPRDVGGQPLIWVVAFTPSGVRPTRTDRRYPLSLESKGSPLRSGVVRLDEFSDESALRAVLGWDVGGAFRPWAVGRFAEEWAVDPRGRGLLQRASQTI